MGDPKKKQKFLNLPKFTGGKKAFAEFLMQELKYPDQALQAGIEGSVFVEYEVDDNGNVFNSRVINGIGYGCDEEALRVVSLLRYEKVTNRGVRLKSTVKTKINFQLPARITYNITPAPKKESDVPSKGTNYEYTISF